MHLARDLRRAQFLGRTGHGLLSAGKRRSETPLGQPHRAHPFDTGPLLLGEDELRPGPHAPHPGDRTAQGIPGNLLSDKPQQVPDDRSHPVRRFLRILRARRHLPADSSAGTLLVRILYYVVDRRERLPLSLYDRRNLSRVFFRSAARRALRPGADRKNAVHGTRLRLCRQGNRAAHRQERNPLYVRSVDGGH